MPSSATCSSARPGCRALLDRQRRLPGQEARAKSKLKHYVLLISLLSAVLAVLFVYLYRQLRKLSRTQVELSRVNATLRQLNDELGDKNRQLSESNELKEQYIARFFALCSLYIDKMNGYRKSLTGWPRTGSLRSSTSG